MLPSSASTNPTIVLVHGAWRSPECFDSLRKVLEDRGYPTEAPGHPSVGAEPPTKTLEDDVINMQIVLNRLIEDEGKEGVLVGHSYGGTVRATLFYGLGGAWAPWMRFNDRPGPRGGGGGVCSAKEGGGCSAKEAGYIKGRILLCL
ncbi:hypothetical protein CPC735_029270 [Coccidioides posadasii C735 delta SOWgp]|uniref:AB hydrolase-1 domain-containing protein n=1 Tax=Coccidioides posadasii (strain C735) TaxID=222929 RepID=C5P4F1_COCP7|nr:hypothetical protein CPC735_029270 [Coccidioides posadasii C735 delta SOWgp]EER27591.1 hypothetical protein CPC735_029270 [Coccidioides posadasii C735 delta SOWgp]|eukprot:XP_003069736.1 hypothetical protein CPC735_029270 [Coccidioides posadasii C735 delta SOWgp]